MKKKSLGIYVHIPFCMKKCGYCDFLSFVGNDELQQQYCRRLLKEMEYMSSWSEKYLVDTIFLGGGTPSVLNAHWIERILDGICKNFSLKSKESFCLQGNVSEQGRNNVEITIECNPGTLNREKVQSYKEAGVNRISLGLQSADNQELRTLGRIHTWEQFLESSELVKNYFDNWNVDLMSALPGQNEKSYRNTLEKVVLLEPSHISAYSLMIEEGTPFYEKYKEDEILRQKGKKPQFLPDEDEERQMYKITGEILEMYGYKRYEISNYTRPGYTCRHNERYWKREDYVGFGLGASSCMGNVRFKNTSDMKCYLQEESGFPKEEVQHLTLKEQMEETMFLGLRRMEGIDREAFRIQFGRNVEEVFGEVISALELKELLQHSGKYIQLTQKGIDVSNYVMAQFLLDF